MSIKKSIFFNTLWSIGGQFSSSLIQLVANVIFARYLTPVEFGHIGIVIFFVFVSTVLVEGGLGGALVRKIDLCETDFSTVFIFNFFVSILLYIIIVLSSGVIANFYGDTNLKVIIIVVGSVILFNSLNFIQNNRLIIALQFKKLALYRFYSVFFANIIGIFLIILGFGIWSIITTLILTPLFLSIVLWSKEGGIGKLVFSRDSFNKMFSFGINTTIATLIDTTYNNIYQLILGRFFSIADVGLYYQAKKLQDVPNSIVFGTTNSVIFSSLSKLQADPVAFSYTYRKIINYFSLLIGLITLITICFTQEIIYILYGKNWLDSSFYLFILSIASFFYVHEMFNRVIYKTFDKTRIILQLEILKKIILSISILIGVIFMDIKVLIYGFLIVSIFSYLISSIISNKYIIKNSKDELLILAKILFSILVTYIIIFFVKEYFKNIYLIILILIPFSITIYLLIVYFMGIELDFKGIIRLLNNKK